jgi:hypothetical protein
MIGSERPVPGRTPAELCKQAITLANDSQSNVGCLRAITMAICGLAGEVHQLGKQRSTIKIDTVDVETLITGGTLTYEELFGDDDEDCG